MPAPNGQVVDRQSTALGVLARLWWMAAGNFLLVFPIIFIVQDGGGFLQTADWVFWITLASLVLVRYADIRFLGGCTGAGEPASMVHWVKYAALLSAISIALWVLAHVAGYLLAARTIHS
jgi:hypothetical protein